MQEQETRRRRGHDQYNDAIRVITGGNHSKKKKKNNLKHRQTTQTPNTQGLPAPTQARLISERNQDYAVVQKGGRFPSSSEHRLTQNVEKKKKKRGNYRERKRPNALHRGKCMKKNDITRKKEE